MKKLFTILAILIVFSAGAFAQVPSSPISFYAGGALSIPTAPDSFSETFKNGFHGMVGVGYDGAHVFGRLVVPTGDPERARLVSLPFGTFDIVGERN